MISAADLEHILARVLAHQAAPSPTPDPLPPNPEPRRPAVPLPERFDGTRSQLRGFLIQLSAYFSFSAYHYTDAEKVTLLGTVLSGPALAWFATLETTSPALLTSFEGTLQELRANFDDPHRQETARQGIRLLRQGSRSVTDYSVDFRRLAADAQWSDDALLDHYCRGLSTGVRDMMALMATFPTTLAQAIEMATRCGLRIAERRLERSTYAPSDRPTQPGQYPSGPRGHLSAEEKARRFQENLCLYCGEAGHRALACPISPRDKTQPVKVAEPGNEYPRQ
jgi:hypothetical protein